MATRYSGDLKINITYDPRNFYRTSVSRGGELLWRGRVNPAPAGFGPGIAYDSPEAYDEIAGSALSFANDEVGDVTDSADYNENLSGYLIRRSPRATAGATSHATRKSHASSAASSKRLQIEIRKVRGRWQPMTTSGVILRGNVYNADGGGYKTKQGAEEAATMFRQLGKSA